MKRYQGSLLLLAFLAYGCDEPTSPETQSEPKTDSVSVEHSDADHSKSDHSDHDHDTSEDSNVMTADAYNDLNEEEKRIIISKGTEMPGSGALLKNKSEGTYICRQCNAALFGSEHKFESNCGWPSFDDEIEGAVKRQVDADGSGRVEIVCANCDGHLGHVFEGERFTEKNTRHCVNSVSMKFVKEGDELPSMIKLSK